MDLKNILALIAGLLCVIQGIMTAISGAGWILDGVVSGVLSILLGIVIIMMSGFITDKLGIPYNLVTAIIFCILCFIFGSWWGGICLIIAIILFILKK